MLATGQSAASGALRRPIAMWLACVCSLVVAMLVVGGITRLTGSGLSIVSWRPVTGILPPLSEQDWRDAFAAYQASPEYRLVNAGMTLDGFKRIFFWEYTHRLLGRFIGVAFVGPWLYFLARKAIEPALNVRLSVALALGALQGVLGWWMVKSGLIDVPHVSQYRLAAHLGLALVVLSWLFWTWLELRAGSTAAPRATSGLAAIRVALRVVLALVAVQILFGALTAGLHAGIGYNTFPTMHGRWVPPEAFALAPAWRNAFENPAAVQLAHRVLGVLVLLSVAAAAVTAARATSRAVRRGVAALALVVVLQFTLGVATLVLVVPIALAALHQLGACVLLLTTLHVSHIARSS